jgi:hypothetical protein
MRGWARRLGAGRTWNPIRHDNLLKMEREPEAGNRSIRGETRDVP